MVSIMGGFNRAKMGYKVGMLYLTSTWETKNKMSHGTVMMLEMTKLLLNARNVKVILLTDFYD